MPRPWPRRGDGAAGGSPAGAGGAAAPRAARWSPPRSSPRRARSTPLWHARWPGRRSPSRGGLGAPRASISSAVAPGSRPRRVVMFRHMASPLVAPAAGGYRPGLAPRLRVRHREALYDPGGAGRHPASPRRRRGVCPGRLRHFSGTIVRPPTRGGVDPRRADSAVGGPRAARIRAARFTSGSLRPEVDRVAGLGESHALHGPRRASQRQDAKHGGESGSQADRCEAPADDPGAHLRDDDRLHRRQRPAGQHRDPNPRAGVDPEGRGEAVERTRPEPTDRPPLPRVARKRAARQPRHVAAQPREGLHGALGGRSTDH